MKFETDVKDREFKELVVGDATFEVLRGEDATSKSGNEMIKVKLEIVDSKGTKGHIYDHWTESMNWKIKHFCEATNITNKFERGQLSGYEIEGLKGVCVLCKQGGDGEYKDKICVKDYKKSDNEPIKEIEDDDLPF